MIVKELIEKLKELPNDATVMYRHNQYGRIDIDEIHYGEEDMLFGYKLKTVTLEGKKEN